MRMGLSSGRNKIPKSDIETEIFFSDFDRALKVTWLIEHTSIFNLSIRKIIKVEEIENHNTPASFM